MTLAIFKFSYAPATDTFAPMSEWLTRLTDVNMHLEVFRGFVNTLNFGQWVFSPLPLMAIHLAIGWKTSSRLRTCALVVGGMLCGYYVIYLFNPEDAESRILASFDRLLMQVWPAVLIGYSMIVAPREAPLAIRAKPLRAALVLGVTAVAAVLFFNERLATMPAGSTPDTSKAHIELSHSEVTAGQSYSMTITGLPGTASRQVFVSYSLDGKPMGQFNAYLGRDGRFTFQVSTATRRGTYRFLAVRTADNPGWMSFDRDAAITVK
jgi:hypothetical protein